MAWLRSMYTDTLHFYGQSNPEALAGAFGTPLYVYNEKILREHCRTLLGLSALPGFGVNYSVKANANPILLRIVREEGLVVDAMSPGELYMDQLAGFTPEEIIYISNNNSEQEMANALAHGLLISVDSLDQLDRLGRLNPGGRVMTRLNLGIGAGHSDKVITGGEKSKFGITTEQIPAILTLLQKWQLTLAGVNQHIGSLFMEGTPYLEAAELLLQTIASMPEAIRKNLQVIDFGGGFGIPYHKFAGEACLDLPDLGHNLHRLISTWADKYHYTGRFLVEPGRYVMAESCVLLGRVQAVKENGKNRFVGTDLGFNVLMRPVLYDSFHEVEIYREHKTEEAPATLVQTITGNICESGDILAKARELPILQTGDLLGILDAGAYGYSMSSNYNQRERPAEVLIQLDGTARLIRKRETLEDLQRSLAGLL